MATRLQVRFGFAGSDQILILDVTAEQCRLAGGDWTPATAAQSLVDAELAGMHRELRGGERPPHLWVHSPDGRIRIDYYEYEHRNNEWLPTPEIRDLERGRQILKHNTAISDARREWTGPGRFALYIVNYAMPELVVRFDIDAGTVQLQDDEARPIEEADALIDRWLRVQDTQIEWPAPLRGRSTGEGRRGSIRSYIRSYIRNYDWRPGAIALLFVVPFMLWLAWYGGLF